MPKHCDRSLGLSRSSCSPTARAVPLHKPDGTRNELTGASPVHSHRHATKKGDDCACLAAGFILRHIACPCWITTDDEDRAARRVRDVEADPRLLITVTEALHNVPRPRRLLVFGAELHPLAKIGAMGRSGRSGSKATGSKVAVLLLLHVLLERLKLVPDRHALDEKLLHLQCAEGLVSFR